MSSPQHKYYWETPPTWLERRPRLERVAEILLNLFVLTAPVGAGFTSNLDLLALYSPEISAALGSVFRELADLLDAIVLVVWVVAVAVWLGSYLIRPHDPFRFEDMPFALTAPSFVFYLIALAQGMGG